MNLIAQLKPRPFPCGKQLFPLTEIYRKNIRTIVKNVFHEHKGNKVIKYN